jgi:hypothetical protein
MLMMLTNLWMHEFFGSRIVTSMPFCAAWNALKSEMWPWSDSITELPVE